MALTTINNAKELSESCQPLQLAIIIWPDATVLRLSSHPLNSTEGGYAYGGNDYLGRILSLSVGDVQALGETGLDIPASARLTVADPDKTIYASFERNRGFKGATLRIRFVFWDANTATFSSDYIDRFVGVCDPATPDETRLTITATNILGTPKRSLPNVPVQMRCPWINPTTTAQRAEAGNTDSPFYPCGETRDTGTAPPCSYTTETCTQPTRRANITWAPPPGGRAREYVSGQWIDVKNNGNNAKYGDWFPMVYGRAWLEPPIMNVVGDGNFTRGEAVLCVGEIDADSAATSRLRVVVNGVELMPAGYYGPSYTEYSGVRAELRWNWVTRGTRDGAPNADRPYDGAGDPYGGLAAIMWVVPKQTASAESIPNVRALVSGPKIRVYTGPSTYTTEWSDNPIWILMDLLIRQGWNYADFDMAYWVQAGETCNDLISYTDQFGNSGTHKRFTCNLAIRQRRSIAEMIRGVRLCSNAILQPNRDTGLLGVMIEGTLAAQQGAPVAGSNYDTAVTSKTRAGVTANGYLAYQFDETNIISLAGVPKSVSDLPNKITVSFQDAENNYAPTSLTIPDSDDIARAQQEITGSVPFDGPGTWDQAWRLGRQYLRKTNWGNEAGLPLGTRWFELTTSFKGVRLLVGQIVSVTDPIYSLTDQLFRIYRVKTDENHETMSLTLAWHNDDWYVDSLLQSASPLYSNPHRDREPRPAFAWAPNLEAPDSADPLYDATDLTFRLTPNYSESAADGTAITTLDITGLAPVNDFSSSVKPPLIRPQADFAGGGSIAAGTYYLAVCAKDSGGAWSAPSLVAVAGVTSGSSQITVTVEGWDSATSGYALFAGRSPLKLTAQVEDTGTPGTIGITSYKESAWGLPDVEADRLMVRVKRVTHSGLWAQAAIVGTGTLQFPDAGWTTDEWAGYDVSVLALEEGVDGVVPVANMSVTSNTADTLTVTPDPETLSVGTVCLIVMRSNPTVAGNVITDAKWANTFYPDGLTVDAEKGYLVRAIAGTGKGEVYAIDSNTATALAIAGDWIATPWDSTTRYIVEEPNWLPIDAHSEPITNANPDREITMRVPLPNVKQKVLLILVSMLDGGDNAAPEFLAPVREVYWTGSQGTIIANLAVQIAY